MVRKSKQYYLNALKNNTLERGEYALLLNDGVFHIGFYENREFWTCGYNRKLIYKVTDTCEEVLQIFKTGKTERQLQFEYDHPKSKLQLGQVRLLKDGRVVGLHWYKGYKSKGNDAFTCYADGAYDVPGHGPKCRNLYPHTITISYKDLEDSKLLFTPKELTLNSWVYSVFVFKYYTEEEWKANNECLSYNLQSNKRAFLENNPEFDESIFDFDKVKTMGD